MMSFTGTSKFQIWGESAASIPQLYVSAPNLQGRFVQGVLSCHSSSSRNPNVHLGSPTTSGATSALRVESPARPETLDTSNVRLFALSTIPNSQTIETCAGLECSLCFPTSLPSTAGPHYFILYLVTKIYPSGFALSQSSLLGMSHQGHKYYQKGYERKSWELIAAAH